MTKPSDGDSHRTESSLPQTAQSVVSAANFAGSASRELWLVRHGETEWSKAMRHTGRTDLPLTEHGRRQARDLEPVLAAHAFDLVLSSPLRRARETATLADYNSRVQLDENLMEWDYGTFEGQTASELARRLGSFSIWTTPASGGESLDQVAARADRVLARTAVVGGRCLLFSHGHLLRILTASWLGLGPAQGRLFALDAGSLCILGMEHGSPVIRAWNLSRSPPAGADRTEAVGGSEREAPIGCRAQTP
jgi:broad specificity phosphatase PhoE